MPDPARPLEARFRERLRSSGVIRDGARVVVALSGGLDSCVLLHLLRFTSGLPRVDVICAHFDHGMRPSSAGDARWVSGLCAAWGVRVEVGRASEPLRSEQAARRARYGFLESVGAAHGASVLLTAHHADDQAETVLFRIARGSGLRGIRGIPSAREGVLRPLLEFWRDELAGYATRVRLSWREDPTNRDGGFARNAIRHRILPELERSVAPGARRALVRLAHLARADEWGWESVLPLLLERVRMEESAEGVSVDREALGALDSSLQARVLRSLARRVGGSLDARTTRRVVDFVEAGVSGGRVEAPGGLLIIRELDRLTVKPAPGPLDRDLPLEISDPCAGSGRVVLGGRARALSWEVGSEGLAPSASLAQFPVTDLSFPLLVRARLPGDRIVLRGGTRKLKRVLLDARIPLSRRGQWPVLVDARGRVLWVPGVARAALPDLGEGEVLQGGVFTIRVLAGTGTGDGTRAATGA